MAGANNDDIARRGCINSLLEGRGGACCQGTAKEPRADEQPDLFSQRLEMAHVHKVPEEEGVAFLEKTIARMMQSAKAASK